MRSWNKPQAIRIDSCKLTAGLPLSKTTPQHSSTILPSRFTSMVVRATWRVRPSMSMSDHRSPHLGPAGTSAGGYGEEAAKSDVSRLTSLRGVRPARMRW